MLSPLTRTILSALIVRWKRPLAVTYSLTLGEKLCYLCYPATIGFAIDGLLQDQPKGLLTLLSVWLLHLGLGYCRQRYDTQLFTRVYASLAVAMISRQLSRGSNPSEVSARSALSRECVDFFEKELPAIFHNLLVAFGSVVMLCVYDARAGAIAVAALLPVLLSNARFANHADRFNKRIHDRLEREVDVIGSRNWRRLDRHFDILGRWRVALSNAEAANWARSELVMIATMGLVLWTFTQRPGVGAGSIYAVLAYLWDYFEVLWDLPTMVGNLSRVNDIAERLDSPEERQR